MKIVLAWIQGSWKWTQWKILEKKYHFKIFDTGAHIREIAKEESPLGKQVKDCIDQWMLVPIEILKEIIQHFLSHQDPKAHIIFDGIPRNIEQKKFFDEIVPDMKVIHLALSKEEAEQRVIGRRICFDCQTTYPKTYQHNFCENCWGKIWVRVDDSNDKALQKRIDIFMQETLEVINTYKKEGKVFEIDARNDISEITKEIEQVLWLDSLEKSRIRELESTTQDINDLRELYTLLWKSGNISQKNVYLINKSSRDFLLWYELDNKIVGTISLTMILQAGPQSYAMIDNFFVLPNYRWLGIGSALLQEVEWISGVFECDKIVAFETEHAPEFQWIFKKFQFETQTKNSFVKYL